jgi:hypothetical protein
MKKPPTRFSADGRWWWDGEQWKAVDETPPAPEDDGVYPSLRTSGSGRHRLTLVVALAVLVVLVVLALWLIGTRLALPQPSRGARPTSTPSARPRPSPTASGQRSSVQRYRQLVASAMSTDQSRVATLDRDCAAPANLAVCRSALVALGKADAEFSLTLEGHPAPSCLRSAAATLGSAIAAQNQAESTAVAGIDRGRVGSIESGLAALGTAHQQLGAAAAQVNAATC